MAYLKQNINKLESYGQTIKGQGQEQKGQKVIDLAKEIDSKINDFENLKSNNRDVSVIKNDLNQIIAAGKKSMGEDRKAQDIIAHIILACTGVGLIIMLGNKMFGHSHSFYLNKTKRQKMLEGVREELVRKSII